MMSLKLKPISIKYEIFFFLFFFFLFFYAYYLYKYPRADIDSHLLQYYPQDLILKTGGNLRLPKDRIQHFLNFQPLKQPGSIRIGALGDSYTYGDEVEKTESYPYQLQELFNQKFPNKKIEILNFGIGGVSFQEQFFLWEKYAKNYGLDYILVGPSGLHHDRGLTFRRNWDFEYLGYPKTRFILSKKDRLNKIHIKGGTLKKRYKNYYTLIPSWTALRYDKRPFQIWEKLIPKLRNNIYNPFYYTKMPEREEASKINTFLLEKIRNLHNKKILFFTDISSIFNDYRPIEKLYNLNYFYLKKKSSSRFYKVFDHKSSLGNEIVAKIYFNILIGKKKFFLNIINCHFKSRLFELTSFKSRNIRDLNSFSKNWDEDLFDLQSIQLTDGNNVIATLRHNSSDHHYNDGSYLNYKVKGTKSFIAFFSLSDFLNSSFIPMPIQLKEGMKIYIQLKNKIRVELGAIQALDTYKKLFVFYSDFITRGIRASTHHKSYFTWEKLPDLFKRQMGNLNNLGELFVEGYKLGELQHYNSYEKKDLRFIPVNGYKESFLMMGAFSNHAREQQFSAEFPLYIQYNADSGESFKSLIPKWYCKKEKQLVDFNLPSFEPLNLY